MKKEAVAAGQNGSQSFKPTASSGTPTARVNARAHHRRRDHRVMVPQLTTETNKTDPTGARAESHRGENRTRANSTDSRVKRKM